CLLACIEEARTKNADILSGGISGFTAAIQVSEHLYWVEKFSGLQFTVIFRKFFQAILNTDFGPTDAADYKLCSLTDNKFFIYPFISIQKDFGYSDATPKNNKAGIVKELFKRSEDKIEILKNISQFYQKERFTKCQNTNIISSEGITIPTYVINLPERTERRSHILQQFEGKDEFTVEIIEACRHKIGAVGLWLSIKKVIETAQKNDDNVIILCEDDHKFTQSYNRDLLLSNIVRSGGMGCNILSGGIGGFNMALPITEKLFWIDSFWCTQFIVIFKKFFQVILNEPFKETDTADGKFSEMTSQKMVLYPFVSVQKDFGYSDVTIKNQKTRGLITQYFEDADKRLLKLQKTRERFNDLSFENDLTCYK
ncbi:MAG: hypothetical protein ACRDE2_12145, partial [Chitinophagaceae bacterium]